MCRASTRSPSCWPPRRARPVVVLTGLAEESAGLAAVAAGAQDYLIKGQAPPDVFGRAIRYAAQRKQVEQASAALQVSALRAEENARLERALLPTPLIRTGDLEVVAAVPPGPGPRAARRRLLRRGGDLRRHRARGHRRRLRARRGRGGARGLPAGGLAVPGPGRGHPAGPDGAAGAAADGRAGGRIRLRHPDPSGLQRRPAACPAAPGRAPGPAAAQPRRGRADRGVSRARGRPGAQSRVDGDRADPAARGRPGAVHRRAVRGPDRAGQRAAR